MNDDDLIRGLRDAARRSDDAPTGTDLDAPLGELFEARVAARIGTSRRGKAGPRRVWMIAGPPLAMAAAFALWLARPSVTRAPLPEYAMEVSGGVETSRGAHPAPRGSVVAQADGSLTLLLRPASGVTGALETHTFASPKDGTLHEVSVTTRASASGSIEIRGSVAALVDGNDATLVVVIARAGAGVDAQAIASGSKTAPPDVKVAKIDVHVAR